MKGKRHILIVDDDPVLCSVLSEGMIDAGFYCQTALDGASALRIIGSRHFDIMITDILMPGIDGFELTREAKRCRPNMAVIVMTGYQQDESYDRAVAVGASDFIKKPFRFPELLARISRVLRDHDILCEIRLKQEEVRSISRIMIEGIDELSKKRIAALEQEIIELRKKLA